jgi:hypothetical protein
MTSTTSSSATSFPAATLAARSSRLFSMMSTSIRSNVRCISRSFRFIPLTSPSTSLSLGNRSGTLKPLDNPMTRLMASWNTGMSGLTSPNDDLEMVRLLMS